MILLTGNPNEVALVYNIGFILVFMAFIRYVLGFKYWRNYSTLALALSAYLFSNVFVNFNIGLIIWTYVFGITILFASIGRRILRTTKMNYYARLGLIYSSGIIGLLLAVKFLSIFSHFNAFNYNFSAVSVLLIISALDDLTVLNLRKSGMETMRRILGTFVIAIISALLMSFEPWNLYLYMHQELFILVIAALLVIAKWSHLNLVDILRFYPISNKTSE